jgi:hypothetical protein
MVRTLNINDLLNHGRNLTKEEMRILFPGVKKRGSSTTDDYNRSSLTERPSSIIMNDENPHLDYSIHNIRNSNFTVQNNVSRFLKPKKETRSNKNDPVYDKYRLEDFYTGGGRRRTRKGKRRSRTRRKRMRR